MSRHSERPTLSLDDARYAQQRRIIGEAIEKYEQDLLAGIRVYLKKFGVIAKRELLATQAADVLQETVVQALRSARNYDPQRPARMWLLGVAINVIRGLRRDLQQERKILTPIADTPHARNAVHQNDGAEILEDEMFDLLNSDGQRFGRQSSYTIGEILSVVNESDREILRLRYIEGLQGVELAAELEVSEGAAYTRLSRATGSLRQAFLN